MLWRQIWGCVPVCLGNLSDRWLPLGSGLGLKVILRWSYWSEDCWPRLVGLSYTGRMALKDHYWSPGSSGHKAVVSQDIFSKIRQCWTTTLKKWLKKQLRESAVHSDMFTNLCHNAQVIKYVSFHLKSKVYFNFNSISLQTDFFVFAINFFFF